MARKSKPSSVEPNPNGVVNRDVLNRLNFMYQAAVLLSCIIPQPNKTHPTPLAANPKPRGRNKRDALLPTQPSQPSVDGMEGVLTTDRSAVNSELQPQPPPELAQPVASTSKLPISIKQNAQLKRRKPQRRRSESSAVLASRVLVKNMADVAKKATIRMDPCVKRTFCVGCKQVLLPGLTSRVRINPSGPHAHIVAHACLACRRTRRLPAPPHLPPPQPDAHPTPHPGDAPPAAKVPNASPLDAEPAAESGTGQSAAARETRWARGQRRRARRAVFFEREGHVTFVGSDKVERDV